LKQSFKDFEFIIVDDDSSDQSPDILKEFAQKDGRIILLKNEDQLGLATSLNKALGLAKGKYIARMDADDISYPERLYQQFCYLEAYPEIILLGCSVDVIGENGEFKREMIGSSDPVMLRWNLLLGNAAAVVHPTAMWRAEEMKQFGAYADLPTSQDLELFSRLFAIEPFPIDNLKNVLLAYREHDKNTSHANRAMQFEVSNRIRIENINKYLGVNLDKKSISARRIPDLSLVQNKPEVLIDWIGQWLALVEAFCKRFPPSDQAVKEIYRQTLELIGKYVSLNPKTAKKSGMLWAGKLVGKLPSDQISKIIQSKLGKRFG
jgi:glycosyltransferase involved in cell wall biosynthesis